MKRHRLTRSARFLFALARVVPLILLLAPAAWAQGTPPGAPAPLSRGFAPIQGAGDPAAGKPPQNDPFAPIGGSGGGADPLESGFGPPLTVQAQPPAEEKRNWRTGGFLRLDSAYNVTREEAGPGDADYRGLNKLRLALQLELTVHLPGRWRIFASGQANRDFAYDLKERETFTQETLDAYAEEAEARELWISGTPLPSLDVKVGRQIVVWGKSDVIRVVDVLNPLDNREPGLTELEDLRLPVTMTRLDYYLGDWALQAVAVHEIRFNKNPVPGSEFYPFPSALPEAVPSDGGDNTEYGLRLSGTFSGWDLALYWANFYDDTPHVGVILDSMSGPTPTLVHSRLSMGGAAANVALGNWLLKGEAARFSGLEFANAPGAAFRRTDALVGLEFSGITDTTLSLEAVNRHLQGYEEGLLAAPDRQAEDATQYVISYRGSFLRDQLEVLAVWYLFGTHGEQGGVQRYGASYELGKGLTLAGGVAAYQANDGTNPLLNGAEDNDRLYLDLKYDF